MDDFERQLKEALAREEPPAWFEAKVMAAVAQEPERRKSWWGGWFAAGRLRWASAALATVMVAGGIAWEREREARERAAGEQAKAKLELALKITSAKLRRIEQQVAAAQENNN